MSDGRIWGPDLWKVLHRYSLAYPRNQPPEETQKAARAFYNSHKYLLPCPYCRAHYAKYFDEHFTDETTKSRASLVKWVFDLHNEVNKRLGKPILNITVDDLPRLYNSFPLRYVDLKTGSLLDKGRYETIEGRDCPMDEKELVTLQKQWLANSVDEHSTKSSKPMQNTVLADSIPLSNEVSFWATPLGVSLIWLIALAAVVVIVLLIRYFVEKRKRKEEETGETKKDTNENEYR